jgi:hypothetical protein
MAWTRPASRGTIVVPSPAIPLAFEVRIARRYGVTRAQDQRRDEATAVR